MLMKNLCEKNKKDNITIYMYTSCFIRDIYKV